MSGRNSEAFTYLSANAGAVEGAVLRRRKAAANESEPSLGRAGSGDDMGSEDGCKNAWLMETIRGLKTVNSAKSENVKYSAANSQGKGEDNPKKSNSLNVNKEKGNPRKSKLVDKIFTRKKSKDDFGGFGQSTQSPMQGDAPEAVQEPVPATKKKLSKAPKTPTPDMSLKASKSDKTETAYVSPRLRNIKLTDQIRKLEISNKEKDARIEELVKHIEQLKETNGNLEGRVQETKKVRI